MRMTVTTTLLTAIATSSTLTTARIASAHGDAPPVPPEVPAAPPHLRPAAPEPGEPASERAASPEATRPWRKSALLLDLGLGVVGLAYERFFERRVSAQIEGHIFGTWFGPIVDLDNLSGWGGQLRPSFFLTDDGPRGLYLSPYLRVNRVSAEIGGEEGHRLGWSTGGFVGYGFLFAERVTLRVGAGLQYMSYRVDVPTGPSRVQTTKRAFEAFFPALDLQVGYVF